MGKKKNKKINPGQVIIPVGHPNPPEPHEIDTAVVLARHFQCTVEFLIPVDDFMRKTADISMLGTDWELKSPTGASRATVGNQFRRSTKQARNIVIDTRRTPLEYNAIEKTVIFEMKNRPSMKKIHRIILIDKNDKVVEIQK